MYSELPLPAHIVNHKHDNIRLIFLRDYLFILEDNRKLTIYIPTPSLIIYFSGIKTPYESIPFLIASDKTEALPFS